MPFIIGFILGTILGCILTCTVAYNKINAAYMDGYNAGRDDALHRMDRRMEDDCK